MMVPQLLLLGIALSLLLHSSVVLSNDEGTFLPSDPVGASPRIVGGDDASKSYPYFILWSGCGASLIHNDIALTAAHCTESSSALVNARSKSDSSIWTPVDRVVSHPDYDSSTYDYDIAVFRLGGWFERSTVTPNGSDSVPDTGAPLTILGFGGDASVLQEGTVDCISPSICNERWKAEGYTVDSKHVICAGNTGISPCNGDSGGPLLEGTRQVGIVSTGASDCNSDLPTIYSRVSVAADWIAEQVCDLSQFPPSECQKSGPGKDETRIRVDILHDSYPEDTSWTITKVSSERIVARSSDIRTTTENGLVSKFVDLKDGEYMFTIYDQYGDGLGSVGGRYHVYKVDKKGYRTKTLASGGGDFGAVDFHTFTVKSDDGVSEKRTKAPTGAPAKTTKSTSSPSILTPTQPVTSSPSGPVEPPQPTPPTEEPRTQPTPSPVEPPQPTPSPVEPPQPTPLAEEPSPHSEPAPHPEPQPEPTPHEPAPPSPMDPSGRKKRRALQEDDDDSPTESPSDPDDTGIPTASPTSSLATPSPSVSDTSLPFTSSPMPTGEPTVSPMPTGEPTVSPMPTGEPTVSPMPSKEPTVSPMPSNPPSISPMPSTEPSNSTMPSDMPSDMPSHFPSASPGSPLTPFPSFLSTSTEVPATDAPTTSSPTNQPTTEAPTNLPSTEAPTNQPSTEAPTNQPSTEAPTNQPSTEAPTNQPTTEAPTIQPTTEAPTMQPTTEEPTNLPSTEAPTNQPTTEAPTNLPTTEESSIQPTTEAPTIQPTTEAPTIQPTTEAPTVDETEPPTTADPTFEPSTVPLDSPEPTETISEPPTSSPTTSLTDGPTLSPQPTTESPTRTPSPSTIESEGPTTTESPTISTVPSTNPTSPSPSSTELEPSASPTIFLISYLAQVEVSILRNPEDISWRILRDNSDDDADPNKDQIFGYSAGSYTTTGTFSNLVILTSGSYEIQLTRDTLDGDAISSYGIVNFTSGLTDPIGVLDFVDKENNTTVVSTFVLP